jgi:predicted PurR-regulated permease PerM
MPAAQTRRSGTAGAQAVAAVVLGGAALHWLAPILTPVALAVFLLVMIDGLARALQGRVRRLGPTGALSAAIFICIAAFAAIIFFVAENAAGFVARLDSYVPRLNLLLSSLAGSLHVGLPLTVSQLMASIHLADYLPVAAGGVQAVLSNGLFILVYLGFMLASRHGFERKTVRLFHGREGRHEAMHVIVRVRDALERYVWIQTVCGGYIAVGAYFVMLALGLESAFFWAFLIFVIGYIPIIGAAIGIVAPVIFALVQFSSVWPAVILLSSLLAITFIVGNILMPRMQGKSLNLDPVLVLFSLGFWGALWGVVGMFLSTPLTVLTMVVLAQFESTRWIAVLLSAEGDPDSEGPAEHATARRGRSRKGEVTALSG